MRLKMTLILIILTLSLSSCATNEVIVFGQVEVPPRIIYEPVGKERMMQCPVNVRKSVYVNIKSREQYIETLLDVIKIHNGVVTK